MLELSDETTRCPECGAVFATRGYESLVDPEQLSIGTKLFQGDKANDYMKWLDEHPLGFVLIHPRNGKFSDRLLHRNGCEKLQNADCEDIDFDKGSPRLWRVCTIDWHRTFDWLNNHAFSPFQSVQVCEHCLSDLYKQFRK